MKPYREIPSRSARLILKFQSPFFDAEGSWLLLPVFQLMNIKPGTLHIAELTLALCPPEPRPPMTFPDLTKSKDKSIRRKYIPQPSLSYQ